MKNVIIQERHLKELRQAEHVLEFLNAEKQRLAEEIAVVARLGVRRQLGLERFLQINYGIDAQHTKWTLDTDNGIIVVPEEEA